MVEIKATKQKIIHRFTIKGLLDLMMAVQWHGGEKSSIKGYEKLTEEQQRSIGGAIAGIQNELGEHFEEYYDKWNKLNENYNINTRMR